MKDGNAPCLNGCCKQVPINAHNEFTERQMKTIFGLFTLVVVLSTSANLAPITPDLLTFNAAALVDTALNAKPALTLVFGDEFNSAALNLQKWQTQYVWGRTNGSELQYYSPSAFTLGNGTLNIKAEKKAQGGKPYTSGMITTYKSFRFTYGIVKARLRLPAGKGLWPAFWLLDYAGGAQEIDIMEMLGHQPTVQYMTLHFPVAGGGNDDLGTYYNGTNLTSGFHIFTMDWNAQRIIWYVDGVERYRVTTHIPTKPMYLIANLAVGGDWPGSPDQNTQFPASYSLDYIRIYK